MPALYKQCFKINLVDKNILPTLQKIKKTKAMNRRDVLILTSLDDNPQTCADTTLDDALDNYDYYNELSDDDD